MSNTPSKGQAQRSLGFKKRHYSYHVSLPIFLTCLVCSTIALLNGEWWLATSWSTSLQLRYADPVQKEMKDQTKHNSEHDARSVLNFQGDLRPMANPIWANASNEHEAAYLLANGAWLQPSIEGGSRLNDEEINFLKWAEGVTSNMTVEQASKRVAFSLWNQKFTSLYSTADSLPIHSSEYMCRMSWGFHWCDPLNHGYLYHGTHWSNARGVEILESFVRLSDNGRVNPSMMYMGDSVIAETWQAGLCSLARANVAFINPCPKGIGVNDGNLRSVCFQHQRINGTGVLAFYSDQQFSAKRSQDWKSAVFGCTSINGCQLRSNNDTFFKWDVVLPNLGMHYNLNKSPQERERYINDITELIQILLDHAQFQIQMGTSVRTLHMFWASSPQHWANSGDGTYLNQGRSGCSAIYPSKEAFGSNRQRTNIVWNIMIQQLSKYTGNTCSNVSIWNNPSQADTKATLQTPCISDLLNTCSGG